MRPIMILVLVAVLLRTVTDAHGAALDPIGVVKTVTGDVTIGRNVGEFPARVNQKVYQGDVIKTGTSGRTGLVLEDDTLISLGGNSRLRLENFAYRPPESKLSFIVRIFKGTASFLCGQIAKLSSGQMIIETPDATVGVRGTHVLIEVD